MVKGPPLRGLLKKRRKKGRKKRRGEAILVIIIITLALGSHGDEVKIRGATFEETNGLQAFKIIGKLHPHSRVLAVKMVIKIEDKIQQVKDFEEALGCGFIHPSNITSGLHFAQRCGLPHKGQDGGPAKCDPRSANPCCSESHYCGSTDAHCMCDKCFDFRQPQCDEAAQLRLELEAVLDVFTKEGAMATRSWGDFTGSILGILNFFLGRNTEGKLHHVQKSLELVVDEVDANRVHGLQVEEAIKNMTTFTNRLQKRERDLEHRMQVTEIWNKISRNGEAILAVLGDALHHRLSVKVLAMIDLQEIWGQMKEAAKARGEDLAFSDWQTLLMLPVSFYGKKGEVGLLLLVPSVQKNTRPMRLYRFDASPLYLNGTFFQVEEEDRYLAVDADDGSISYTREELDRCAIVGDNHFCSGSYVRVNGGQAEGYESCLMNLYRQFFATAAKRCMIRARPATEMAWSLEQSHFVIALEKKAIISVKCDGDFYRKSALLEPGMYKMKLDKNCQAFGGTFSAFSNGQDENPTTLVVYLNQSHVTDITSITKWDAEDALQITYPTAVEDARKEVEEELWSGGFSTKDIIFMACGAVALLAIAIVVIIVVFKTKK